MPCRVLLVEDHPDLSRLMVTMIEDFGFPVVGPAGSVKEAAALVEVGDLDVALVDQGLPDGPGTIVVRDLIERGIPAAVLSGYHRDAEVDQGLEAVRWLLKPVDPDSLHAALEALCADAKAADRQDTSGV